MRSKNSPKPAFAFNRPINALFIGTGLLILALWLLSFTFPARADGGGPLPTNTVNPFSAAQPTMTPLPLNAEVNTFQIVIDSNQNATVVPYDPASQSARAGMEPTPMAEEEFASPLWVFGFFMFVIFILVINALARGIRNRA